MTLEKIGLETLRYLFAQYVKGPAVLYGINQVTARSRFSAEEVSNYLLEKEWIRERWMFPDGKVTCKITIKGIEVINPVYVRTKLLQIVGGLGEAGGSKELLDILENNLKEYSVALDIVRQLETMGYIRIRHLNNNLLIELTDSGRAFYNRGSKSFFTLMAY